MFSGLTLITASRRSNRTLPSLHPPNTMPPSTPSSSPPQPSKLASLFLKVPETAELIVYELSVSETTQLLVYTEPAIYNFCRGPCGGFDRFAKICRKGKRYRWDQNRLLEPPRLLVEQWQRRLLGKRLVDEDGESTEDVGLGVAYLFYSYGAACNRGSEAIHLLPWSFGAH